MEEQFYCVTIDLDALQARLGHGTREETVSWLKLVGFTATRWPGAFIGEPDAIEELERNEDRRAPRTMFEDHADAFVALRGKARYFVESAVGAGIQYVWPTVS